MPAEASVNEFVEGLARPGLQDSATAIANASWSRRKPSIAGLDNGGGNGITPHWGPSSSPDGCMTRHGDCLGEQALGLPPDGWFSFGEGIGLCFGGRQRIRPCEIAFWNGWSGVVVSERT